MSVDKGWAKVVAVRHLDNAVIALKDADLSAEAKKIQKMRNKLCGSIE